MKIIFRTDDNHVSILAPAKEWADRMDELAKKDVPRGLKYKIVEDSVIPSDRSFRGAWEVDAAELTDGVGEQE